MNCGYCPQQATDRIPSLPDQVCQAHALEFWTGLMSYAKQRSVIEPTENPSGYWVCHQMSGAKLMPGAAALIPWQALGNLPLTSGGVGASATRH